MDTSSPLFTSQREVSLLLSMYRGRPNRLNGGCGNLLDLNMPIMDGFGFLDAFKSLDLPGKDHVKIIIVSSSVSPQDIARAKRAGASQYLSKPVNEQTLRRALKMCEEEV